ncbi:hypothetical protein [Moellerella wisconsensis]|uniref:Uncharacterized protein n=3 Tax=Moellerella wisconsensis TaxID=158849 RepID=A0A0N0IAX3_9GAMM|nr:hypothetical protein [Moellerella wisconsensis]KLN96994.1 membrane protein [Moellerella wisconsensis]KPD03412.1 hypothetical protein M992_1002 [Moellerella wisconsensis ATCC 35017]UNH23785.1 hypothetical protein MNY68_13360 [Moellerella wisconsensis]UNH26873.1 hypothetical protein MNY64_13625 [Moellerella wisconsensis]UNH30357.1 hypothetical protein MNY72_13570 [Moellerella wisconsensis]
MKKLIEIAIILVLLMIITALGDAVGGSMSGRGLFSTLFIDTLIAMALLAVMSFAAYLIGQIPLFNKLPVIFWVSIISALLCSPLFPYDKEMIAMTSKVSIAVISTVVLAFAGLSLGKDIDKFKAISWRIIPVSLAVFSGTFLFAALIGQLTLSWSGVI